MIPFLLQGIDAQEDFFQYYLAMGGQIVEAPKQCNAKRKRLTSRLATFRRHGRTPHKLRQEDIDARWIWKCGWVRVDEDGREREVLLILAFGYQNIM